MGMGFGAFYVPIKKKSKPKLDNFELEASLLPDIQKLWNQSS